MTALPLLRRWRIRTRLLGLLAITALLLLCVGAAGLKGLRDTQALTTTFIDEAYGASVLSLDLGRAMGDVRRFEKDMIIAYEAPEKVAEYRQKWLAAVQQVLDISRQLAENNAEARPHALAIQAAMSSYQPLAAHVAKQLEASAYDTATVANRMLVKAKEEVHRADKAFAALTATMRAQAENTRSASQRTVNTALVIFGVSVLVAVVLMSVFTLLNVQSICAPLDDARRLADHIALGDLTGKPNLQGADEAAALMAALARMQDSLRQVVGQVQAASVTIQHASAEVASGNSDLSQRTESAAGSLQQTASSMEQLTATVRQSADAARQASALANSATQVAAHGGSVVAQVVATMEAINTSSRKIADIIGTIDGIAFQTNILALNAAVEAARAGEQGRGFAVVASEVRSLAQRSAEAAREIKVLIGASVDKVETGTRQVADAGSTMGDIVASVRRVNDIISEISAAAGEQSSGIGQVNGAVAQLDQSTQQNAALVEQSAAAAESLREEASRLAQVVATFKLQAAPV